MHAYLNQTAIKGGQGRAREGKGGQGRGIEERRWEYVGGIGRGSEDGGDGNGMFGDEME